MDAKAEALAYLEAKHQWQSGLVLLTGYKDEGLSLGRLFIAVDDAAAVEVVRAELNRNTVAGEDADEVFAHAPGDMGEGLVLIFKLDLEHGIGQGLYDDCHHFNCIFLRQTLSLRTGVEAPVPFISSEQLSRTRRTCAQSTSHHNPYWAKFPNG